MDKFITQAEADRMRAEAITLDPVDWLRMPGVAGTLTVDYYVVPDGDPRLQQAADLAQKAACSDTGSR